MGDAGTGKTNIIYSFTKEKIPNNIMPTVALEYTSKIVELDDKRRVKAQIWDTAGQEKFQSLGYAFYRGADCCALVYDITSQTSFENLNRWKAGFIENAGPSDPHNFPFVCLGNKLDQESLRQVPTAKG